MSNGFDEFSKHLAGKHSRRDAFKFLGASVIGAALSAVFTRKADAKSPTPYFNQTYPKFNQAYPKFNQTYDHDYDDRQPKFNQTYPKFNQTHDRDDDDDRRNPKFNQTYPKFNQTWDYKGR